MIMKEKKLRHLIARFEGIRHSSVTVLSVEVLECDMQKVRTNIQGSTIEYLVRGDAIEKAILVI